MKIFFQRFTKFFKKEKSEKRESRNKNKSSEKGQFQGCFKCGKMDHMIKDCPLLKEEQRRNSKKQQELASKAFKKAMKSTWGETSDEESEGEDGEGNLALMTKSDTDSNNDSSEVSTPSLNEGMLLKIDSLNVPSEPRQKLENLGGTNSETMLQMSTQIIQDVSLSASQASQVPGAVVDEDEVEVEVEGEGELEDENEQPILRPMVIFEVRTRLQYKKIQQRPTSTGRISFKGDETGVSMPICHTHQESCLGKEKQL
ncbi:hypothetical protein HAX54_024135 [Datura stramonium]|uniref:CCHC-type domain-containing protein n=1 Tax=Datura stramonium TaxID=4076 RepID=A0ABS8S666_DATST|nr:hypothetical protein [Datura stramonium]